MMIPNSKPHVLRRRALPSQFSPDQQPDRHYRHNQVDHGGADKHVLYPERVDPGRIHEHDNDGDAVANENNADKSVSQDLNRVYQSVSASQRRAGSATNDVVHVQIHLLRDNRP